MRLPVIMSAMVALALPALAAPPAETNVSGQQALTAPGGQLESRNGLLVLPNVHVAPATLGAGIAVQFAGLLPPRDVLPSRSRALTPAELAQGTPSPASGATPATKDVRADGVLHATLGSAQMSYVAATRLADGRLVQTCLPGSAGLPKTGDMPPKAEVHHDR